MNDNRGHSQRNDNQRGPGQHNGPDHDYEGGQSGRDMSNRGEWEGGRQGGYQGQGGQQGSAFQGNAGSYGQGGGFSGRGESYGSEGGWQGGSQGGDSGYQGGGYQGGGQQ